MGQPQSIKIEFPCLDYPVKVFGESGLELQEFVLATTENHAPDFDRTKVSIKFSRQSRFQSITVYITATGPKQLQQYHQALIAHPAVKMVL